MSFVKRAVVGVASFAIAGTVLSFGGVAHAESKFYGGYSDAGTCNYWRYAVRDSGYQVTSCTWSQPNKWHFTAWR
ncbi:hypothetical protein ACLQ2R_34415 [Streptosporangium sp. DT93]|uniref:hypothetical protein n=1 Tax=Streptosporangium sp. DT93 TaxID=3393428 RepID=UPI003CED7A53